MSQKAVVIAAKLYEARALALRLRPDVFYERILPYQKAIRENMEMFGQSELQVLVDVLGVEGNENTKMWFMAAAVEMLEPSKAAEVCSKELPPELWQEGDIVSRDGNDEHEILAFSECRDLIDVKCIKEPPVYEGSSEPWTRLGDVESNLTYRYSFVRSGKRG